MVQDISDQKRIEDELRISEEKFSKAFMNSPNAITLTRLSDGKIIDANNSVRKILGYELKDTKGRSTVELGIWINPNDRIDLQRKLQEQGFVDNQEIVLRSKDGNKVIVSLSASLIEINNEKCLLSSFIDITELKKAQEALRQSQELFSKAFHSISFPVSLVRILDNQFVDVNDAFLGLIGFNYEEVIGHTSKELELFPNYSEREEYVRILLEQGSVQ